MNLFSLLEKTARRFPDHPAICVGSACIRTYRELEGRARALAGAFVRTTKPGDRIGIASPNCAEYPEILFGAWAAGLVIVPINAKLHALEVAQILEDAAPKIVFVAPKLAEDLGRHHGDEACVLIEIGGPQYDQLLTANSVEPVDVEPGSTAWLFFTSGTTGRSKGAMLSHRNLMAMTIAHLADFDSVEATHSLIHAAPMSHGSGLYILPYVARGARQVVPASGGFDPADFLALCSAHPGCSAFLAPTMVHRLRLEAERSGTTAANLRTILYGGGPMYLDEICKCLDVFGDVFIQLYGQGEAPMTITGLRRSDHRSRDPAVLASVGWPRSGVEVAVVDDQGERVGPGDIGEIVCRGDVVMLGYWNDEATTRETLRDGWLYTGDVGALDEDGKLTLHDRRKDVIISGGSNIYPREVEEVLLTCPGVEEVSVIGQENAEWGEVVVAVVVPSDRPPVTDARLDAHCLERLARFKRPRRYIFVETLPKSSYGKVLKRELRALL